MHIARIDNFFAKKKDPLVKLQIIAAKNHSGTFEVDLSNGLKKKSHVEVNVFFFLWEVLRHEKSPVSLPSFPSSRFFTAEDLRRITEALKDRLQRKRRGRGSTRVRFSKDLGLKVCRLLIFVYQLVRTPELVASELLAIPPVGSLV